MNDVVVRTQRGWPRPHVIVKMGWGSFIDRQITQMGELFSSGKGDGVFGEENTMLPMLTVAVAVAIWTPVTVAACKWIADA